jgi:hypothetical protein
MAAAILEIHGKKARSRKHFNGIKRNKTASRLCALNDVFSTKKNAVLYESL